MSADTGFGVEPVGVLEREPQVHFALERGAQPIGDELNRVLVHKFVDLHALGRAGVHQLGHIAAALGGPDPFIVERGGPVADLHHLRTAKVVVQTWNPGLIATPGTHFGPVSIAIPLLMPNGPFGVGKHDSGMAQRGATRSTGFHDAEHFYVGMAWRGWIAHA